MGQLLECGVGLSPKVRESKLFRYALEWFAEVGSGENTAGGQVPGCEI